MKAFLELIKGLPLCVFPGLLFGYTAPGPEVEDGYYRDPSGLTERWFPKPEKELRTPGAKTGRWSTVEEVYAALDELALEREDLEVREVGESLLGVPIRALFQTSPSPDAVTVLVQARVHGNEPASTEGALELAYELARGDLAELDMNIIILPVLNPEGAREMRRRTGTDIDPNRDYILHKSGSIRAVYRLMREYDPEVVMDMHEHDAYAWPYDLMTIGPNNPNIPEDILSFTNGVVIGGMKKAFDAAGLHLGPYRLLDFQEDGVRVRESATTFVSEKNALAMAGRISLLTEGRGIGLGTQHFHRRTFTQYTAARSVLETVAENQDEIRRIVAEARNTITSGKDDWVLRVDPVKVPSTHELVNAETFGTEAVETTYWERTKGTVVDIQKRPAAYVLHASEAALADRLRRFGLEMTTLNKETAITVETLSVDTFNPGSAVLYGGELLRSDGAPVRPAVLRNHEISMDVKTQNRMFPQGSWIVSTAQPNALYLITLEPRCLSGFASLGFWGNQLDSGFEFPVYRLMDQGVHNDHDNHASDHRD
ncbi:hypothetical protein G0Q06_07040 [Puniceicoccales bacterium CK1056]|uniref:Peptidase M14 domain-containing protein n=1 Tax=Oceanipulchritudo coccoides TaxID=2706888 RepID=A0A6B2LZV3_9BACT|nr:M14 family zinc carboxypeptidase [Oceanipulchritudo coccoides]NDV62198.1 hypothetical protein [Oceanipulchritudo coccoides]